VIKRKSVNKPAKAANITVLEQEIVKQDLNKSSYPMCRKTPEKTGRNLKTERSSKGGHKNSKIISDFMSRNVNVSASKTQKGASTVKSLKTQVSNKNKHSKSKSKTKHLAKDSRCSTALSQSIQNFSTISQISRANLLQTSLVSLKSSDLNSSNKLRSSYYSSSRRRSPSKTGHQTSLSIKRKSVQVSKRISPSKNLLNTHTTSVIEEAGIQREEAGDYESSPYKNYSKPHFIFTLL
jgi:hypothetical protein